jgi:subtilisin family serine protease
MQISSSTIGLSLASKNPGSKRVEKATDYVGRLETTGKGVGIAVIDSGIYPHPDIDQNLAAAVTFYSDQTPDVDQWGHGTGTAGIIVGSGKASDGEIRGVAPDAKVLNLQVLTKQKSENAGEAVASMLSALNWTVDNKDKFNIKVINISGALAPIRNDNIDLAQVKAAGALAIQVQSADGQIATFLDPLDAAIKRAVAAGIVVVCAAGNEGPQNGTVWGTPNYRPDVITVGSLDTNGTPGNLEDDFIAQHSARGPTITQMVKPDLVAPGVGILMPASPNSDIVRDNENLARLYEGIKAVPDRELLPYLSQAVSTKQLPSKPFEAALSELSRLLPAQFSGALERVPREARTAMALKLTAALAAKGVLDTEGEPFLMAVAACRQALERFAPNPTFGTIEDGQPAYLAQDGTSFATPIVSSVVAHMFEANPDLTPDQVKEILMTTARPVPGADRFSAGAGALNAQAAIEQARLRKRDA